MRIVGHTGLTRAIMEEGLRSPAAILNYLNHYIIDTLHQRDNMNVKDGMDIALSVIDISTNELTFAGAFNPLYQIRNGALNIIDANKFSIGGFQEDEAINEFEEETITIDENDQYYMFSDGYADQFGGPKDKKFMVGKFKKLLVSIAQNDSNKQMNT